MTRAKKEAKLNQRKFSYTQDRQNDMRTNTIYETCLKMNTILNKLDPATKVPPIDQWAMMAGLNTESMQSLVM